MCVLGTQGWGRLQLDFTFCFTTPCGQPETRSRDTLLHTYAALNMCTLWNPQEYVWAFSKPPMAMLCPTFLFFFLNFDWSLACPRQHYSLRRLWHQSFPIVCHQLILFSTSPLTMSFFCRAPNQVSLSSSSETASFHGYHVVSRGGEGNGSSLEIKYHRSLCYYQGSGVFLE